MPRQNKLIIVLILMILLVGITNQETQSQSSATITIGSKEFTEQLILGEMYAQLLEDAGFKVERKLALGGTPALHEALINEEIDVYPEYTGTALMAVLDLPVNTSSQEVYDTVVQEYQEQFDIVWLDAAPMNNTYVLVMTQEDAEEYGITTISDMVAQADKLTMAGTVEFANRDDGLPGLMKVYGEFEFRRYIPIEPDLKYRALTEGIANVITGFGTDGEISEFDLVSLEDDKWMFPPYQVAPVIRQQVLDEHPEIADILNALAPLLTDEVMRELNYQVSGNNRPPKEVARDFLKQEDLIQ